MDFGFSEEQEMLRKSARDFLAGESPMTYVRQMMEDDRGFTDAQWKQMAELGWMGLILPEQYGGAGGDFVDMVVVLEEMGRAVLPGPFFATVVLGGVALLEGGSDGQKASFLPKIAAGDLRVTLAQLEPNARWDAEGIELQARKDGGGYRLAGTKLFVPDAHTADVIIVAGREPGSKGAEGVTLFLVDAGAPGIKITLLKTMDQTRKLCEVVLEDVRVPADRVLGAPGAGWKLLERIVDRGKVGLCAEMCGGAQKVLEMSVEYAKVREEFGGDLRRRHLEPRARRAADRPMSAKEPGGEKPGEASPSPARGLGAAEERSERSERAPHGPPEVIDRSSIGVWGEPTTM